MKHLVQIQVTPAAGNDMEARPGGPGPVIGRIIERFKPEAVYMSPTRREIFLVCELDAQGMAELMLVGGRFAGRHPEFTPVVDAAEFGAILGKAMPAAGELFGS